MALERSAARAARGWLTLAALTLNVSAVGCSVKEEPEGEEMTPVTGAGSGADMGGPSMNNDEMNGMTGTSGSGPAMGQAGSSAMPSEGNDDEEPNPMDTPIREAPPEEVMEMLDANVDWTALTLVYPSLYTAYDGEHLFQVPIRIDGAEAGEGDWIAIPSSAVSFDPDPETGGVLVTVLEDVPEITIAVSTGMIGGTAQLHVTSATPEQWAAGLARYDNGVEFNLPEIDFASAILDPNWMPPAPPPNLGCKNCHSTGAKYFEIQHTPTQAARFSDSDLETILAMGMKPEGVEFRVLPEMLGGTTAVDLYAMYHKWETTEDEIKGLIVYLRSLTPTGQGDILLPDGTYVPPGSEPPTP